MLPCPSPVMRETPEELSFIPHIQMASNTCSLLPVSHAHLRAFRAARKIKNEIQTQRALPGGGESLS